MTQYKEIGIWDNILPYPYFVVFRVLYIVLGTYSSIKRVIMYEY